MPVGVLGQSNRGRFRGNLQSHEVTNACRRFGSVELSNHVDEILEKAKVTNACRRFGSVEPLPVVPGWSRFR